MDRFAVPAASRPSAGRDPSLDRFALPEPVRAEPRQAPYEDEGAPYGVRAAVGSARSGDRLETIRRFFPDAEPTEDGNFVYTDPRTKRRTLYNPKGLDLGDVPSVYREVAEGAGALGGGALGAVAGPAGAIGGAATGAVAAGKAVDAQRLLYGLPQRTDLASSAADTLGDAAAGATGEAGGRVLGEAGRGLARALIRPGAGRAVADAERAGVPLTASQVARGPLAAGEGTFANVLPGSRPQRAQSALYDRAEALIRGARPETPGNPANAVEAAAQGGAALKQAAEGRYAQFRAARERLDDQFYSALPSGARFRLPAVQQEAAAMRARIESSPGVQGEALAPAMRVVERLEADLAANRGAVPADILRATRRQLGAELETQATTDLADPSQAALRQLYRTLNQDLRGGAAQLSPAASRALARQDRLVRAFRGEDLGRESVAGSLDRILKANSDEAAFQAFNSLDGGVGRARSLVRRLGPDERRVVGRAAFERIASSPDGTPLNPSAWARRWLDATPEVKQLLFGPTADVGQLDALARALKNQGAGAAFKNTSGTGYEVERFGVLKTLAQTALAAAGGAGAATGNLDDVLLGLGTSYGIGELVYHPAALRALVGVAGATGPARAGTRAAGQSLEQARR